MAVQILAVAGRPSAWVAQASDNYLKRMPRAWRLQVELLPPSRKGQTAEQRKQDEWQRLEKRLAADATLIVLDERGQSPGSRVFAADIESRYGRGESLTFLIGGPDGVADAALQRADASLCVSPFTLPHELARVVLIEQLYRAYTIIENHPYHRD